MDWFVSEKVSSEWKLPLYGSKLVYPRHHQYQGGLSLSTLIFEIPCFRPFSTFVGERKDPESSLREKNAGK
jgi:hypothetical protein